MSAVFGRRSRVFALALFAVMALYAEPAHAEDVTVSVDEARIMKLPDRVATIVIGNPLIADAALQGGGVLVLTGKGFGSTNMLALDRAGKVVMDTTIQVVGPASRDLVVVYKGIDRESYSCAPECEKRLTLGDSQAFFGAILGQAGTRNGGGGGGGAPAPR
ncbi:MAG: pilus assembly protein N-terminal domain-containing protein [Pseudolabrys sp.]|nr:pilus assembly protein N-terminal domain-containing protein [Pseudolabrys sp.]